MSPAPADLPAIWAAPLAGGPSTTELAVAVGEAGGLGFVAGGYIAPAELAERIRAVEERTAAPYGVNLFLPSARRGDPAELAAYASALGPLAERFGVALGEPVWEDDAIDAKLEVVCRHRPAVVSFTFAAPSADVVARVREATGAVIAATVTTPAEARVAAGRRVDALALQGAEAGGHRGVHDDDPVMPEGGESLPALELLARVRDEIDLPLVAAGGLMSGADVRRALDAGAFAAQLGTAFLCCPEAGTSAAHRRALLEGTFAGTRVTRAFTGRPARGLDNAMARDPFGAPAAYPEVHHLTRPLRAVAAAAGDLQTPHFWAGTGWRAVREEPAGDLVARLRREAGIDGAGG